jgi:hypothetical protein
MYTQWTCLKLSYIWFWLLLFLIEQVASSIGKLHNNFYIHFDNNDSVGDLWDTEIADVSVKNSMPEAKIFCGSIMGAIGGGHF